MRNLNISECFIWTYTLKVYLLSYFRVSSSLLRVRGVMLSYECADNSIFFFTRFCACTLSATAHGYFVLISAHFCTDIRTGRVRCGYPDRHSWWASTIQGTVKNTDPQCDIVILHSTILWLLKVINDFRENSLARFSIQVYTWQKPWTECLHSLVVWLTRLNLLKTIDHWVAQQFLMAKT